MFVTTILILCYMDVLLLMTSTQWIKDGVDDVL